MMRYVRAQCCLPQGRRIILLRKDEQFQTLGSPSTAQLAWIAQQLALLIAACVNHLLSVWLLNKMGHLLAYSSTPRKSPRTRWIEVKNMTCYKTVRSREATHKAVHKVVGDVSYRKIWERNQPHAASRAIKLTVVRQGSRNRRGSRREWRLWGLWKMPATPLVRPWCTWLSCHCGRSTGAWQVRAADGTANLFLHFN